MFKVLILLLFLMFMYLLLLKEKRVIRVVVVLYFVLVSVLFLNGHFKIAETYHLYEGPVPDEGFRALGDWVGLFSYFFIVPAVLVIASVTYRVSKRMIPHHRMRMVVYLLWLVFLLAAGFVSFFIFTLIFYGFAP